MLHRAVGIVSGFSMKKNYNRQFVLIFILHVLTQFIYLRMYRDVEVMKFPFFCKYGSKERGHWAVYYISPQSFKITFSYSMA